MISQKNDILVLVRQKMLDENQHWLVSLPQDLEANFARPGGRAGKTILPDMKSQFAAAVPVAVVDGILEYLAGSKASGNGSR